MAARARGIAPVIPYKANEKNKPTYFAKILYKARARIEQGFGRLKKRFRDEAFVLCDEKQAQCYQWVDGREPGVSSGSFALGAI